MGGLISHFILSKIVSGPYLQDQKLNRVDQHDAHGETNVKGDVVCLFRKNELCVHECDLNKIVTQEYALIWMLCTP